MSSRHRTFCHAIGANAFAGNFTGGSIQQVSSNGVTTTIVSGGGLVVEGDEEFALKEGTEYEILFRKKGAEDVVAAPMARVLEGALRLKIKGDVKSVRTMAGHIEVTGDVQEARTMSGNVTVHGDVHEARTMSGNIHYKKH